MIQLKSKSKDLVFVTKATLLYGSLAVAFSFVGLLLPERQFLESPIVNGFNIQHILGHIVWGLMIGVVSFSLRYFLLAGAFAIIIDWDHLIQFFNVDGLVRMGHSIPFGFVAVMVLMAVFGRKNYLLGAIAFSAMLAHISFDTLSGTGNFPLFAPFYDQMVKFPDSFWFIFQLVGLTIVISTMVLARSKQLLEKEKTAKPN
jgi:hypothetical protein